MSSQSSLTNDQLTAHLTAEEREILEKVDCDLRFASRSDARCVPWHSRDCLPHTHTHAPSRTGRRRRLRQLPRTFRVFTAIVSERKSMPVQP